MVHRHSALLLVSVLLPHDADAIVIRHDVADSDYVKLGSRYPAAVSVLPDGSGTLVAPRFVLTAAHVGRGVADRQPRVEIEGSEIDVDRVFIHRDWSGRGAHDIALLRLKNPVVDVTPALIHRRKDEVGRTVTFVGCGDTGTGESGPVEADGRKRGATNRVDDADADWLYFTFDEGEEATPLEGVSGPGDSGGPAFVEVEGTLHVVGVSVFSFNGKPGRYGTREGYTRVSVHADWIDSIVSGSSADPGIAPGEALPDARSEARAMAPRGLTGQDLSDVPAGTVIAGYIETFNGGSEGRYSDYLDQHFAKTYLARKTSEEHLAFYQRLQDEFGRLTVKGVVGATAPRLVIRVRSEKGPEAEFHFTVNDDERIEGMMVAKIDVVRR